MSLLERLAIAWQESCSREAEIADTPESDLIGIGLDRAGFAAIVGMPDEHQARMWQMAEIFGVPDGTLNRVPALRLRTTLTCAQCAENSLCRLEMKHGTTADRAEMFCPNADTWRSLAQE